MKNGSTVVREFHVRTPVRRAGFVPSYDDEHTVECWSVWCKNTESGEERRATYGDMRSAGFKKKKARK